MENMQKKNTEKIKVKQHHNLGWWRSTAPLTHCRTHLDNQHAFAMRFLSLRHPATSQGTSVWRHSVTQEPSNTPKRPAPGRLAARLSERTTRSAIRLPTWRFYWTTSPTGHVVGGKMGQDNVEKWGHRERTPVPPFPHSLANCELPRRLQNPRLFSFYFFFIIFYFRKGRRPLSAWSFCV